MLNYADRFTEYSNIFENAPSGIGKFDDALTRVIDKAMRRIFDASRQSKLEAEFGHAEIPEASDVYEIIGDGIKCFIGAEISQIIGLIDQP